MTYVYVNSGWHALCCVPHTFNLIVSKMCSLMSSEDNDKYDNTERSCSVGIHAYCLSRLVYFLAYYVHRFFY